MMQMLFPDGSTLPTPLAAADGDLGAESPRPDHVSALPGVPLWGPHTVRPNPIRSHVRACAPPNRSDAGVRVHISYGLLPQRCRLAGPLCEADRFTPQAPLRAAEDPPIRCSV